MRKNFLLITTMMVLLLTSCGKKEEVKDETPKVNPKTFKVEIEGTFKKDDELILFWKDKSISFFDDNHTIYQGIKGSIVPQKVVFEFQEGDMPNDIRLDISSKKEQNEITLNYIKLEQESRSFMILKDKFTEFFRPNEFISLDAKTGIITTKEINGAYDPIFFTTPIFFPQMEAVLMTRF
ncbi:hypothetical protein [Flavobacterium sp.]|jgi:uncharacterized lipoprotein YehR (DUF1307 family)|uniref:hypothetical protein n=1 Tax=Flavobacterium sp. TaxID=239 RepID=UPI0037C0970E